MGSDFEYHKEPEKTASAHLDQPGVFTFGDIGYLDEDGYLFMSDRKIDDHFGGVNIYPAEIEGVLTAHAKVQDAAVFGIPNEEFGEEVKAAVELVPGAEASEALEAELVAYVREHLAGTRHRSPWTSRQRCRGTPPESSTSGSSGIAIGRGWKGPSDACSEGRREAGHVEAATPEASGTGIERTQRSTPTLVTHSRSPSRFCLARRFSISVASRKNCWSP